MTKRDIKNLTREAWDYAEYNLQGYEAQCNGLTREDVPKHFSKEQVIAWQDGYDEGVKDDKDILSDLDNMGILNDE